MSAVQAAVLIAGVWFLAGLIVGVLLGASESLGGRREVSGVLRRRRINMN
jgi:hypothetical protein